MNSIYLNVELPESVRGMRLDQALAKCFPEHSRSRLCQWIKLGQVQVNGKICEPKSKVIGGEAVEIAASLVEHHDDIAQPLPLNILFEDTHLLILNKPTGLVVHPAAGNYQGTLLNALLHHAPQLRHLPRAGIVHRLDKDTTGLMVVAKTLEAHTGLVSALQRREIERKYYALVGSEIIAGNTIDAPIGRHPHKRTKMAVIESGKHARTHYRCKQRFLGFTLLDVTLETGRTHQIRVHLSHQNMPIVGDTVYGWRYKVPAKSSVDLQTAVVQFKRQALHAYSLALSHPATGEHLTWTADLPDDFAHLVKLLNQGRQTCNS